MCATVPSYEQSRKLRSASGNFATVRMINSVQQTVRADSLIALRQGTSEEARVRERGWEIGNLEIDAPFCRTGRVGVRGARQEIETLAVSRWRHTSGHPVSGKKEAGRLLWNSLRAVFLFPPPPRALRFPPCQKRIVDGPVAGCSGFFIARVHTLCESGFILNTDKWGGARQNTDRTKCATSIHVEKGIREGLNAVKSVNKCHTPQTNYKKARQSKA
jgi:hypothetical protein